MPSMETFLITIGHAVALVVEGIPDIARGAIAQEQRGGAVVGLSFESLTLR